VKTKIIVDFETNFFKFKVYRKPDGLLKFWEFDKSFEELKDAEHHAQELSKHPHPIAIYKGGKRTK
jgi:hypothetical protein